MATINNDHVDVVREDESLPAGQNQIDPTYIFNSLYTLNNLDNPTPHVLI